MGTNFYNIIVAESTNVANIQCLGLVIRYFSVSQKKVVDTMYRLVPTAAQLYGMIIGCLEEGELPLANLVGIGSDGDNAMVRWWGINNSVSTRLQASMPGIVVFRCVCHSIHLATSKADSTLPTCLESLIRETHNWFSSIPKHCIAYTQLCTTLKNVKPKEIPGHSETRWRARAEAVTVVFGQWEAMRLHFLMAAMH
jgi:hypothetical protein